MNEIINIFSYSFMLRALIVGVLVALCAALLGTSLVLKRYSMIGDGLSHVGYGAFAIAAAASLTPLYVAIPTVIIAAFFLLRLSKSSKINGDSAIAILSSSALAIGMIVLSVTKVSIDVNSYMFGSILALTDNDVILSVICSVIVCVMYLVFYHRIFAVTFDESFSSATGIRTGVYNTLIAVLTAIIIVVGMRLMGAILISGLVIFPPLSAMRIARSFKGTVIASAIISVSCFIPALLLACAYNLHTGPAVICMNILVYAAMSLISRLRNK